MIINTFAMAKQKSRGTYVPKKLVSRNETQKCFTECKENGNVRINYEGNVG